VCVCVCVCERVCGLLSLGQRDHVELLCSVAMMPACHPHYQLPSSHTSHLGIPSLSLPLPLSLHLPFSPPWLCKQSAKYFITSLLNRAETLQIAPHYLHQRKACLVCVSCSTQVSRERLICGFYWALSWLPFWSPAEWLIESPWLGLLHIHLRVSQ